MPTSPAVDHEAPNGTVEPDDGRAVQEGQGKVEGAMEGSA